MSLESKSGLRRVPARLEVLLAASLVALAVQLAWPAGVAWRSRPRPGKQVEVSFPSYRCLFYLPQDYSTDGAAWPLILYLHGSGMRGDNPSRMKEMGVPRYVDQGGTLPAIVASPQCPKGASWDSTRLLSLVEEIGHDWQIDRVIVTGYSMGGYGAWRLAQVAPNEFSAVAPISGGGDSEKAAVLKDLPIWAFHGQDDAVVPVSASEEMVNAVRAAGGAPRFTVYANKGHGVCNMTYESPELFTWLLSQPKRRR